MGIPPLSRADIVTTSSHGGFVLSLERLAAIPLEHRAASLGSQGLLGYFEEDRDWSIVAVAFPEEWRAFVVDRLREPDLADVASRVFEAWVLPNIKGRASGGDITAARALTPPPA